MLRNAICHRNPQILYLLVPTAPQLHGPVSVRGATLRPQQRLCPSWEHQGHCPYALPGVRRHRWPWLRDPLARCAMGG